MPVADMPIITQQYNLNTKPAIEQVCVLDPHNFTMRNYDYEEIIASNPVPSQKENNPIWHFVIDKSENEITLLGGRNFGIYNNFLTPHEVDSMSMLNGSYKNEIKRLSRKGFNSFEFSKDIFAFVSRKLYILPFQNCAVEINSDESMKFTLSFEADKLLMITKHKDPENMGIGRDEVIYSFFINRKLIASDVANLEVFTKNFKEYISL